MAETRVVITADADQAVLEFNRLRNSATGSIQQIAQAGEQLNRAGVSAGQLRAAMAGLPAQITDVVVSLQGGQAPLTVLLQQGGQIVGQFGNVGNALRGVASYVTGLVNPFTVAAAAGTVLAVAFYKGSQESEEFRKSLALTGNAVGATTSELVGMSAATAKAADDTKSHAADALNQLVQTGRVGKENLQQLATATVLANKEIGIKVSDTVATFADLAKSPLEASEKLTEKYHYLTLATYQQIKALQDQGRSDDAARVAQSAYADAISQRAKDVDSSLGYLTRGWNAVGSAAHKAWDWMLDIGREDTFEQKLEKANAALEKAKRNRMTFIGAGADGKKNLDDAQAARDALIAQKKAEEDKAKAQAESNRLNEAGIALAKEWDKYLPREAQLRRDLAAAETLVRDAAKPDQSVVETEKQIADLQLQVRKKYSDIFNAGIDGQIEAIKRRGNIEDIVAGRSAATLEATQRAGLASSLSAQEDYLAAQEALDQARFARKRKLLQEELKLTAGKANSEKDQAALRGQIAELDEESLSRRLKLNDDLFVLDVNSTRAAANNLAELFDKRDAEARAIGKQLEAQRDENAMIGLSKAGIAQYRLGLVDLTAARMEDDAAAISAIPGREAEAQRMRDSAAAMRELAQAQAAGTLKTEDFEQQKRFWDGIAQAGEQTFVSIGDQGKKALDRLTDTLKSGLLSLLWQATAKPWILNIGAQMSGYSGIAQQGMAIAGGGPTNALSGAGNLISGASAIKSGLGLVQGGLIGAGNSVAGFGSAIGSTVIADFGAGLSGLAPAAAQAYGGTLSTAASLGAGLNTAIAAIPGWGWAALGAAAIAGMAGLFGDGPEKNTRLQFASNNAAGNISINERGNEGKSDAYIAGYGSSAFGTFGVNSTFWAPAESETVQSFIKTVSQTDDALAAFLTTTEKASVKDYLTGKTAVANTGAEGEIAKAGAELSKVFTDRINNILEGIEPGLSKLEANFSGTSQELATEAAALLEFRAALRDSGEAVFGAKVTLQDVAALKAPTEATSAALTRITSEFNATNQVAQLLGKDVSTAFGAAGLAGEAMRAQIVLLSGGISNFTATASSFAQNYLSDAERLAPVSKQLDAQLAALGLTTVPKTKDEFKNLVMGLDLSTEGGQKLYAGLMNLQDAFAQVHASERAAADVARERADLQNQLDQLTMTQAQLAEKARNAIDSHNLALYDQVIAAQAAKDAAAASAEAQQKAADAILKAQESAKASISSFGNALVDSIKIAQEAAKAFRSLNDSLLLADASTLSPEQKYLEAKRQFETANSSNLEAAEKAFLDASKAWFGGSAGYAADFEAVLARNTAMAASQDAAVEGMIKFWQNFSANRIGAHANGGVADGWSLVGERGPELVNFTQPGRVYTAEQSRQMIGGGSVSMEETNELLREVLVQLHAAMVQRGAVGTTMLEKFETLAGKLDNTKRVLAKATAKATA